MLFNLLTVRAFGWGAQVFDHNPDEIRLPRFGPDVTNFSNVRPAWVEIAKQGCEQ